MPSNTIIYTFSILLASLLITSSPLEAQALKGWSFDASYHQGRIIRHSPKILFDIPDYSNGVILNARFQTYGNKTWHEWQHFPEVGLALQFYNPGDRDILGYIVGIVPHLNLHLVRRNRFFTNFQVGSGMALIDRFYDPLTNPTNTAIGSAINNMTVFRLEAGWDISTHWSIQLGGSFTHISNAAAASPNLGINIPAWSLALGYRPAPLSKEDYSYHGLSKKPDQRWGLFAEFDLGFRENNIPGGAKLPVYQGFLGSRFSLSKTNDLQFGLGYEYHRAVFEFALQAFTFFDPAEAHKGATRYMFYIADEFRFGKVGIYLFTGIYLNKALAIPSPIANRLGIRYYFDPVGFPFLKGQLYAGVYLKTHRGVAEYAALGGGIRF
ncbi:MAG: acyloxyacyl hydrolase [Saprospiraceae bacterium]|nr:acyloxyacyl hydrolase [Saprospiraceae bacterium]